MTTPRDPNSDPRGHTYTEAWRFECEARWLASLSKPRRDRYLYGDGQRLRPLSDIRGQAETDRLITAARDYHPEARKNPAPRAGSDHAAAPRSVHHPASPAGQQPGAGSSLPDPQGGDSTPVESVVSGGDAR